MGAMSKRKQIKQLQKDMELIKFRVQQLQTTSNPVDLSLPATAPGMLLDPPTQADP
jgi:hypothetical protein